MSTETTGDGPVVGHNTSPDNDGIIEDVGGADEEDRDEPPHDKDGIIEDVGGANEDGDKDDDEGRQ